ncbi:Hypothetical protein ETEE_2179 [Edwardsiella anguillarum ET080813]|uniref:Uncharacterized protein n=1 Tax=Edwardsiella anguillarum ET080813 TaxID=667120 RepID=A0A076LPV9_9GAMM|nr:Hypothetical protein ETEE_2179 [Edwardsiella anguillarum ET080813]
MLPPVRLPAGGGVSQPAPRIYRHRLRLSPRLIAYWAFHCRTAVRIRAIAQTAAVSSVFRPQLRAVDSASFNNKKNGA